MVSGGTCGGRDVVGGCGRCGSGSLSELSEDESEEDDDDHGVGRPVGGCSPSGSLANVWSLW